MNETKTVEKENIAAEKLNSRFAMIGFIAIIYAYLTAEKIIPGFVLWFLYQKDNDMYPLRWYFSSSCCSCFNHNNDKYIHIRLVFKT